MLHKEQQIIQVILVLTEKDRNRGSGSWIYNINVEDNNTSWYFTTNLTRGAAGVWAQFNSFNSLLQSLWNQNYHVCYPQKVCVTYKGVLYYNFYIMFVKWREITSMFSRIFIKLALFEAAHICNMWIPERKNKKTFFSFFFEEKGSLLITTKDKTNSFSSRKICSLYLHTLYHRYLSANRILKQKVRMSEVRGWEG